MDFPGWLWVFLMLITIILDVADLFTLGEFLSITLGVSILSLVISIKYTEKR